MACLVPGFVLTYFIGEKVAGRIAKKNPDMKPPLEYGAQFKTAMADRPFHGGAAPGGMDLSYYGTIRPFHCGPGSVVDKHVRDAGLSDWYGRMERAMPQIP